MENIGLLAFFLSSSFSTTSEIYSNIILLSALTESMLTKLKKIVCPGSASRDISIFCRWNSYQWLNSVTVFNCSCRAV